MDEKKWLEFAPEEVRERVFEKQRKAAYEDEEACDAYYMARLDGPPRLRLVEGDIEPVGVPNFLGWKRLADAFGVKDIDLVKGLVNQMSDVVISGGGFDSDTLNWMVSFVIDAKPTDAIEATLLTDMAIGQVVKGELVSSIANAMTLDTRECNANIATKFSRLFVTQMGGLKQKRTGGEQKVTVERVWVNDGGQAMFGNVTQARADDPRDVGGKSQAGISHSPAQRVPDLAGTAPSLSPIEDHRRKHGPWPKR
jgi:hypothetical protein